MNNDCERHILCDHHDSGEHIIDGMQETCGSYTTVGSTAYSIVRKIKKLLDKLFADILALGETITDAECDAMWGKGTGAFTLNKSKLNVDKLG